MGFCQSRFVSQLFSPLNSSDLEIMAFKVVDDAPITAKRSKIQNFISCIKLLYKIGTIAFRPGSFLFYGLQMFQYINIAISTHGDRKLESLNCFPIDRRRRKQMSQVLNPVELKSFRSVNSSNGWLRTNSSLLCSFYSRWIQ